MLSFLRRYLLAAVAACFVTSVAIGATAIPQFIDALSVGACGGAGCPISPLVTNGNGVAGHNVVAYSPANQTGTASTTNVMLGFGASAQAIAFVPKSTGNMQLTITVVAQNSTIGDGCTLQLSYGTGTAPANGAAVVGTQVGAPKTFVASTAAGYQGVALSYEVTGLINGTAYWLDLAAKAVTGGTCTAQAGDVVAVEN